MCLIYQFIKPEVNMWLFPNCDSYPVWAISAVQWHCILYRGQQWGASWDRPTWSVMLPERAPTDIVLLHIGKDCVIVT